MTFVNGNCYINTNSLFSNERLIFNLLNYYEGENFIIKAKIKLLKGNNSLEPKIHLEENN